MKPSWLSIFTNIAHGVLWYDSAPNLQSNFRAKICSSPHHSREYLHHPLFHPPTIQNHIKFNAHLFWLHNVNKKPFTRYCGRYKNKETAWNFTDSIRPRLVVRHNKTGNITDHISQPSSPSPPFPLLAGGRVLQSKNWEKQKPLKTTQQSHELALMRHSSHSSPLSRSLCIILS